MDCRNGWLLRLKLEVQLPFASRTDGSDGTYLIALLLESEVA